MLELAAAIAMARHERMFRHEHADKLNDPDRERWLPTAAVVEEQLGLRPGMTVADEGAGTGHFAIPMARAVAPGGQVFAVDMQPEMLERLRSRLEPGAPIVLVEGESTRTTPGGRIAILDWRPDVEQPPGPPLEHRIAVADVEAALRAGGFQIALGFMIVSNIYTTVGYFVHERIWARTKWGLGPRTE